MANPYAPPAAPVEGGKKRRSYKTAVWVMLIALAVAGLFAAVAVPAHYDRVYRSQVAAAVSAAAPAHIFADDTGDIGRATIVFRPRPDGDTLAWDCRGGTLAARYRVHTCR